jgi:DNA-binding response OmpR family regulator
MASIVIVEDEQRIRELLARSLAERGHDVESFGTALEGLQGVVDGRPELVILDMGLPDLDGGELLKMIRAVSDVPVVVATARNDPEDIVRTLDAGADDYLVKPFDLEELCARVAAVSRRYSGNANPVLHVGRVAIDRASRRVTVDGRRVQLTRREWTVLERLARRPDAVVSKSQLEDALYAFGEEIESNAVEVHVSRLRKKLGHALISTTRGVGYALDTGR